jgi:TonB family protein
LQVEVSEVGTAVTTSYALAYPFTKRTASTELYVDDGQTMAIGGLIKQKSEEELRKFPWLADIPILGIFFRQRSITSGDGYSTRGDAELFITLTPKIVSEPKETKEAKKELLRERPAISLMDESRLSSVARYTSVVQKYLLDRLNYPPQARQAGFEGRVKLSLHLSYKGELLDAVIKDSSGYNILDENTIHLAKTVDAYPPFPTTIEQQELWIEVPIVYELE